MQLLIDNERIGRLVSIIWLFFLKDGIYFQPRSVKEDFLASVSHFSLKDHPLKCYF